MHLELIKEGWIINTRNVGKAKMFKLNLKNKKVQKFIEFYWTVIDEEVDKQLGIDNKEETNIHATSAPMQLAVSASHV